jgi:hypothetical protein
MRFYWLVLGVLAVWRVTHLLQAEEGPWDIFLRLRRATAARMIGRALECFYCLSIWVALPLAFTIGDVVTERLMLWPALSGAAILLERATAPSEPALYVEDKEKEP